MTSSKRSGGCETTSDAQLVNGMAREPSAEWSDQPKPTKSAKRFMCHYPGCGKLYSRAEHLERHALNHAPKEIFHCTFPNCKRRFVRQDLCARHLKRHMGRGGSGLLKRSSSTPDALAKEAERTSSTAQGSVQSPDKTIYREIVTHQSPSPATPGTSRLDVDQPSSGRSFQQHHRTGSLAHEIGVASRMDWSNPTPGHHKRSDSHHVTNSHVGWTPSRAPMQEDNVLSHTPPIQTNRQALNSHSSPANWVSPNGQSYPLGSQIISQDPARRDTIPGGDQQFTMSQPPGYPSISANAETSHGGAPVSGMVDALNDQSISESPSSIRNDFTAWFFDSSQNFYDSLNVTGTQPFLGAMDFGGAPALPDHWTSPFDDPTRYSTELAGRTNFDAFGNATGQATDPTLSSGRWRYLIECMRVRFVGGNEPAGLFYREEILGGDHDDDQHILSLHSMRCYVSSYWQNFHDQFPILHRPTFSADRIPDLLLLTVMALGASLLTKEHNPVATPAAHRFANFIAWHVRWQIYMDGHFHPPAKLWIFQTLLLLEVYEKMNATRSLHERANVHSPLTVNLMRRSTALYEDLSINHAQKPAMSPQEWWDRWITAEATRRVAYGAFLLDATHAIMFGHPAVMVVQEIRLPLPCDEALWSATSPAEVGMVESCLHANAIKPTTFLQGLKRTLTGRKVRTNTFGRIVLMAGLLSISWHMRQREQQMSTLEVPQAMAVPEMWRTTLVEAFDFWKRDFDENMNHMQTAPNGWQTWGAPFDQMSVSDHATVLHHLGHLAMHIDIADCQIAAGARTITSRTITAADRDRVIEKMTKWCKSENAPQAVHHALQLLHKFLVRRCGPAGAGLRVYSTRDDRLLCRPWVLYFAALVVWCYSHFKRKTSTPLNSITPAMARHEQGLYSPSADYAGIEQFLRTTAFKPPAEIALLEFEERNVSDMLHLLQMSFQESRWELLHEAASRLRDAIIISCNGTPSGI
ncbi:C2H2 finger domain protein, putative [Paecilomyces variotii No. 5]|uniref:C2H2 finger domain protein, putative n=1 Tax=Byssochlamys spectabilis (strain No. 5 / NBRC 109023) TaxID=1356009 RepID=V5FX19_BYSSN|nr:C2H2 finger domain protein, putative [Paecilomyces variotii No. 5]